MSLRQPQNRPVINSGDIRDINIWRYPRCDNTHGEQGRAAAFLFTHSSRGHRAVSKKFQAMPLHGLLAEVILPVSA